MTKPSAKYVEFLDFCRHFEKKLSFFEIEKEFLKKNSKFVLDIRKSENSKNLDSRYHYFATVSLLRASINSF